MMTDQTERLFTYGTLMPELTNHHWIERHVHSTKPGWIRGALADLGAFPALIEGNGIVKGVLLEIDAEGLQIADRIEGYSPDRQYSLYVRQLTWFFGDDGTRVRAWTYYFGRADQLKSEPRLQCTDSKGEPVFSWPAK